VPLRNDHRRPGAPCRCLFQRCVLVPEVRPTRHSKDTRISRIRRLLATPSTSYLHNPPLCHTNTRTHLRARTTSTSSVRAWAVHSIRVNFPLHQSRLLVPMVRLRPPPTHAPARLGTKHRTSRVQGNIRIQLLPTMVLARTRMRLRTWSAHFLRGIYPLDGLLFTDVFQ
jgi:hypothetical protein